MMGERTRYAPGTFCWTDLTTTDQGAAKGFYESLFGWEAEDRPIGEGAYFSMMRRDGKDVASIVPQPPMLREAGAPPTWNSYVAVQSADAAAERAEELGATLLAPPGDVGDSGRLSIVQDPQGAFFMVWQPGRHVGAALVNAPGALCWNELGTPDLEASTAFYSGLFGWTITPLEASTEPYRLIRNGDANNGGLHELTPSGTPPNWLVYFGTEDLDDALDDAEKLGGTKIAGPIDIQMARIGIVQDPVGAVFALYAGELEP